MKLLFSAEPRATHTTECPYVCPPHGGLQARTHAHTHARKHAHGIITFLLTVLH